MKRINNLYQDIISIENLQLADIKARKNKTKTYGVILHDRNKEDNILKLHEQLVNKTYKTSEYNIFKIYEPKEREIYRLPYYPDRIMHHAIMNIMEKIWVSILIKDTYSCIKNRGIHAAANKIKMQLKNDPYGTKYCFKMDIKKFYPSIDHEILKKILRRKIKDNDLLYLLDEIIDSAKGVPIGNYLSQFFANIYLAYFDHWVKEEIGVKYYYRYADDIVILSDNKEDLHDVFQKINKYITENLNLQIKHNYQIFPVKSRGIDFLGYVFYHDHVLLRKSIKQKFCKKVSKITKDKNINTIVFKQSICSWWGWAKHCNSTHLMKKILKYKMKSNRINQKPEIIEDRGDNTYYYNFNIIESEKNYEDGTTYINYDYEQIIGFGEPSYSSIVSTMIRTKYSYSKELALINNYNRYSLNLTDEDHLNEYMEYINYVSQIKEMVKKDCIENNIKID